MQRLVLLAAFFLWLISVSARADIYGYLDNEGNTHFSPEKIDERYQLFLRGDQSFDTTTLRPPTPEVVVETPLLRYLSQHPNMKKFMPLLNQAAQEFNLEPALLKAVMAAESGFNPSALSPKGAIGLMQIMPTTAERYGLRTDKKQTVEQKLGDPKTNIRLGARYLRDLGQMFPRQQQLVIASYNAGEGTVQKYRNTIPPYPETRNYVQLVTQFYHFYSATAEPQLISPSATAETASRRIYMTIPGRSNMPHHFE
jgi:soluble lytic murein transglycosylase-like protein